MEFIFVIVVMILLVGFLINLKKAKRSNMSSRSRSSHTGIGTTTDYISTGSVFSLQDNDNHNNHCSDNTSNYSDSSDGGSSCD